MNPKTRPEPGDLILVVQACKGAWGLNGKTVLVTQAPTDPTEFCHGWSARLRRQTDDSELLYVISDGAERWCAGLLDQVVWVWPGSDGLQYALVSLQAAVDRPETSEGHTSVRVQDLIAVLDWVRSTRDEGGASRD